MTLLPQLYGHSLALLTDLYQFTMAYALWKTGRAEREAAFHLVFRRCPFDGEYAIACGLAQAVDFLRQFRFTDDDLEHLAHLKGPDGHALFEPNFLEYLNEMEFSCDVDAVEEGTVVFAQEPLVRVRGPMLQAQLLETPLLTMLNFQTLVATKAARVCRAAQGDPVVEFGLRRAQGIDGGLSASRAAYVGGCVGTSNTLAGKLYGIPVRGTHAHSWVMAFEDEIDSFRAYAQAMPTNAMLLIDTYDTVRGAHNAAIVGQELRQAGHEMLGVRLDSGDLAPLSVKVKQVLDEADFPHATIMASSDLDEYRIADIKRRGGQVNAWGVGTRLATCYDQPALGGVYKLTAIRDEGGAWRYPIKLSNDPIKTSDPGVLQTRRYRDRQGKMLADVIYDELTGIEPQPGIVDPATRRRIELPPDARHEPLLTPIFRHGSPVYEPPSATAARERAQRQLASLAESVQRLESPTPHPVGVEERLYELKHALIAQAQQRLENAG